MAATDARWEEESNTATKRRPRVRMRPFGPWERRSARAAWAVIPRKRLDISHADMAYGLLRAATALPHDRSEVEAQLAKLWTGDDTVVTLSVRTSFDLLLQALALPPGTHVVMSGVTIRDMVVIAEHHGLRPIPVDLDMATLQPDMELLRRALTKDCRVVIVAHIFGTRIDMRPVVSLVRSRCPGALVVEDAAEAFEGLCYRGHDAADVSLFSFGTIKTATALGGCLMRVSDPALRADIKRLHYGYAVRPRATYVTKLLKNMATASLLTPAAFGLAVRALKLAGSNVEGVITRLSRGFPGDDLIPLIRYRPSLPLLCVLHRVLSRFQPGSVDARRARAREAVELLRDVPGLQIPGVDNPHHSFWLFPICVRHPSHVCKYLSNRGFDVTSGTTQLGPVTRYVRNKCPLFHKLRTPRVEAMMQSVVYLPVSPELSSAQLVQLCDLVCEAIQMSTPRSRL